MVVVAHNLENEPHQSFYGNRREVVSWDYIEDPKNMDVGDYFIYVKVEPS